MKKKAKDWDLMEEILSDDNDIINGPVNCDSDALRRYRRMLAILEELKAKGKLRYEANKASTQYDLHCAFIRWNFDDGECELDDEKGLVEEMIRLSDSLTISEDEMSDEIKEMAPQLAGEVMTLSVRIYTPTN